MKVILGIIILMMLSGCKAMIKVEWYDLETKQLLSKVHYNSARRALIKLGPDGVEIVSGQVTIDDDTAKVLINRAGDALDPVPAFTREPTVHKRKIVHQSREPTVFDDDEF